MVVGVGAAAESAVAVGAAAVDWDEINWRAIGDAAGAEEGAGAGGVVWAGSTITVLTATGGEEKAAAKWGARVVSSPRSASAPGFTIQPSPFTIAA